MCSDIEQVAKKFQNRNLRFTSKKSLNSWWSVNTGGDGKGGAKEWYTFFRKYFQPMWRTFQNYLVFL